MTQDDPEAFARGQGKNAVRAGTLAEDAKGRGVLGGGQKTADELVAEATKHEAEAKALRGQAADLRLAELKAKPLADRLVYAAFSRCPCGAGLAYDPAHEDEGSPFKGPLSGCWDCSAILLGTADRAVKHTDRLPFAFYEVKSEEQPSANGMTTRPKPDSEEGK